MTSILDAPAIDGLIAALTPSTWESLIPLIHDEYMGQDDVNGYECCRWLMGNDWKPWLDGEFEEGDTYRFWSVGSDHRPSAFSKRWYDFRLVMDKQGFPQVSQMTYPDNLTYFIKAWRTGARPFEKEKE